MRVEQERVMFSWTAPARPYRKLSRQIATVPAVVTGLIAFILFLAGEWMLIAVVAALVFAYYTWMVIPPENAEFAITNIGLRAHGVLYDWGNFTKWWMVEKWDQEILMLEMPGVWIGRMAIPVGNSGEKVEREMEKYVLRGVPAELFLDKAARWLSEKFPLQEKI